MPNRLTVMSDTIIMMTGCFLSTSSEFNITSILSTYVIWLIAYILFMSTRKTVYRFLKNIIEKVFNKDSVQKCCDDEVDK